MTSIHTIARELTQCSVDGCTKPHRYKNTDLCSKHHQRWLKHGDPHVVLTGVRPRTNPSERFWSKVAKTGPDECWIFNGTILDHGYGQFRVDETIRMGAHRFAYIDTHGPISDDLTVDHLCCVPRCVNPAHMELVSLSENARRRWERERAARA